VKCASPKCQQTFVRLPTGMKRLYCSAICRGYVFERRNPKKRQASHYRTLKRYPWMQHLGWLRTRCNNPKVREFCYYGGRGIKAKITLKELKSLWFRDKAFLLKSPSVDRIDPNGHYEYRNCRFIENRENLPRHRKGYTLDLSQTERQRRRDWITAYHIRRNHHVTGY